MAEEEAWEDASKFYTSQAYVSLITTMTQQLETHHLIKLRAYLSSEIGRRECERYQELSQETGWWRPNVPADFMTEEAKYCASGVTHWQYNPMGGVSKIGAVRSVWQSAKDVSKFGIGRELRLGEAKDLVEAYMYEIQEGLWPRPAPVHLGEAYNPGIGEEE